MSKLREWRQAKGLTLGELGDLIGASGVSVHRIENGAQWPHPTIIANIERETNRAVKVMDLLAAYVPKKKTRGRKVSRSAAE